MKWTTFNGRVVTIEEIDHQHLSNIFWYFKIVIGDLTHLPSELTKVLNSRFNGQLMEYRPHLQFENEIKFLEDHGMLWWTSPNRGIIVYQKEKIGEIIKPLT